MYIGVHFNLLEAIAMEQYEAHYQNDEGYDWIEIITVGGDEDPFTRAYIECPDGYSLMHLTEIK